MWNAILTLALRMDSALPDLLHLGVADDEGVLGLLQVRPLLSHHNAQELVLQTPAGRIGEGPGYTVRGGRDEGSQLEEGVTRVHV